MQSLAAALGQFIGCFAELHARHWWAQCASCPACPAAHCSCPAVSCSLTCAGPSSTGEISQGAESRAWWPLVFIIFVGGLGSGLALGRFWRRDTASLIPELKEPQLESILRLTSEAGATPGRRLRVSDGADPRRA